MLTGFVAIALAVAPGVLLGFAVPPGQARWLAWVLAPALSLGLSAVAMAWLPFLGLPDSALSVLVAVLVLVATAVVASSLWRRQRPWSAAGAGRPARQDVFALAGVLVVTAFFGLLFFHGFRQPPGWDAMYHGMLTRELLQQGTTQSAAACRTGSIASATSCGFAPLALDVSWAQAAQLSGGRIGSAMLAWEAVVGPLATASAVYVVLRLMRVRVLLAAAAAACGNVVGPMWLATATGRITQQVGPGLAVAALALLVAATRAERASRRWTLAGMAGLVVAGVLLVHTYEVLAVAVLVAAVLAMGAAGPRARLATVATGSATIALVGIALAVGDILGAGGERGAVRPPYPGDPAAAAHFWITDIQRWLPFGFPSPSAPGLAAASVPMQMSRWLIIVCLVAVPFGMWLRPLRWCRPWVLAWALVTAVGIWTASSTSPAATNVAGLWYGVPERLRSLVAPVYGILVVAGAAALGSFAAAAWRRRPLAARLSTLAPASVAAALLALGALPSVHAPLRRDLASRTPQSGDVARAGRWLADHLRSGQSVAYDQNLEMLTWTYVDDEVPFLFGEPPTWHRANSDYAQRWQVWNWLVGNPGAASAGCQVRRFGVVYVVVGGARVPNFPVHYDPSSLTQSRRLDLVRVEGRIMIFKVDAAGMACGTTP